MIAREQKILKWHDAAGEAALPSVEEVIDWIAQEVTLTVAVNGVDLVSFASSPIHCTDLAIGFLCTEGIVRRKDDIADVYHDVATDRVSIRLAESLEFRSDSWNKTRVMTSGCGQGVRLNSQAERIERSASTALTVHPEQFHKLFITLRTFSNWYERTGCIHLSALVSGDHPPILREDIGRHNAVDKVIGAGLLAGLPFETCILTSSGRLSSDMLQKAAQAGIPVVASQSAPTALAVDIAQDAGITLIGFVRGQRLNIYSHPERVELGDVSRHDAAGNRS